MNMKRWVLTAAVVLIMSAAPVMAGEPSAYAPPTASGEFERIKALAGKWEGVSQNEGEAAQPVAVEYQVTSGGRSVVETLFPGTPQEMVSVYHDKNGKLSMTHYCMIGNQPQFELKKADVGRMSFEATAETRKELTGQMYMNTLVLEQPSDDQLKQTWGAINTDGKSANPTVFVLKRTA